MIYLLVEMLNLYNYWRGSRILRMRKIDLGNINITRWVLDARELSGLIVAALAVGGLSYSILNRFFDLPMWLLVIISILVVIIVFAVAGYLWNRFKVKRTEKERLMMGKSEQEPTIIKDTKIKLDAEKTSKAVGMNVDNVPSELSDVQINVKAKDVKEATGLNISAQDAKFALSAKIIFCSCGYVIRNVTTCGYEPIIKCPQCGKEYKGGKEYKD